ncbi:RNA-binding domain-containing protein [Geosporobacter ferrireducens]|uniref:Schlafen AlbA-2 domain-containing protein n=1 Tax=Geosporobacter ferrireducens TaxID=1424294 RepID=A0A1D8GP80_9FIRM|nr:RNA-binding domain-containing protein [Geosporobacter ferrireducens]AOT72703.1 hypothetical protein Gferi_25985 [Geosporobacter ferrireducens]MTI55112.1 transcriptional regulator [Geosporobacter ferrireducens]
MDLQRLKILLKQREGTKLDFKESLNLDTESGKKEFAKDIIAIANSLGGRGYIIIGVEDKSKKIVGIKSDEFEEERIQQIISYRCDPPINIRVEHVMYEGNFIGVITIFKSGQRPHQMRQTGAFYLRRGSTTDFARRDEIASMFQEAGLINNELIPVYHSDIKDLDKKNINQYLHKIGMVVEESLEKEVWNNMGIIHIDSETGKVYPTVGGLLLFCNHPQNYLPHCTLRFVIFRDGDKATHIISGNLIELLEKSNTWISAFFSEHEYPAASIYECIVNAVIHRDYFDIARDIVVVISDYKIEISNPGALAKGNTMQSVLRDHNHSIRNKWLYSRLMVLDANHRILHKGMNLHRINRLFSNTGGVRIINLEKRNLFKIILPGINQIKKKDK